MLLFIVHGVVVTNTHTFSSSSSLLPDPFSKWTRLSQFPSTVFLHLLHNRNFGESILKGRMLFQWHPTTDLNHPLAHPSITRVSLWCQYPSSSTLARAISHHFRFYILPVTNITRVNSDISSFPIFNFQLPFSHDHHSEARSRNNSLSTGVAESFLKAVFPYKSSVISVKAIKTNMASKVGKYL